MESPESLSFLDEGLLLVLGQHLPVHPQTFTDLRVVHLGVLLGHLPPLAPRPDHEGVHRALDPLRLLL